MCSISECNVTNNVSYAVTTHLERFIKQYHTPYSTFVTIDSLNAILDAKLNEWFDKFSPQLAEDASLWRTDKFVSTEGQMKHNGFLLGNLVLELYELRRQNAELTNKLVKSRSLVARCELCNNKNNNYRNIDSELGGNKFVYFLI